MTSYHNPAAVPDSQIGPNHRLLSTDDLDKPLPEGAEYWSPVRKTWTISAYIGSTPPITYTYRIPLSLSDRLRRERDRLDEQIRVVESAERGETIQMLHTESGWSDADIEDLKKWFGTSIPVRLKPAAPTPQSIPWTLEGIEAEVCADIAERQAKGIAKYGVSVADNPLTLQQWLQHAYEETLDQAVYLKRAMTELQRSGLPAGQEVEG